MDTHIRQTSWHVRAAYHLPKKGMTGYAEFKLGLGLENFVTAENVLILQWKNTF